MPDTIPATLKKAITRYATVRTQLEELEPRYKMLRESEDRLAAEVYALMEEFDMKSVTYGQLGRFTKRQTGPWCSIRKDEEIFLSDGDYQETYREQFVKSVEKIGMRDVLIKEVPIMQRVNSYVKEAIKDGRALPEGLSIRYTPSVIWSDRKKGK